MEWDVVARAERQSYQWLNPPSRATAGQAKPVETASSLPSSVFSLSSVVSCFSLASRSALLVFCFSGFLFQSFTETD
jgi:hypothetical protein